MAAEVKRGTSFRTFKGKMYKTGLLGRLVVHKATSLEAAAVSGVRFAFKNVL